MLSIGDYAVHKTTGHTGRVLGYGLRIVNGTHFPTLKVRVTTRKSNSRGSCVEDITTAWMELSNLNRSISCEQPAQGWRQFSGHSARQAECEG